VKHFRQESLSSKNQQALTRFKQSLTESLCLQRICEQRSPFVMMRLRGSDRQAQLSPGASRGSLSRKE
jgi:hypothetical protein